MEMTPTTNVTLSADGSQQRDTGIAGYEPAGFTRDLAKVAVADNGSVGSGPDETVLAVGAVGAPKLRPIWRVGDDVVSFPAWSPSGGELALALQQIVGPTGLTTRDPVPAGLWTIDSDGQHPKRLAGPEIGSVAWSPDGKRIAFVEAPELGVGEAVVATIPVLVVESRSSDNSDRST